jgi:hypothetical protein
MTRLATIALYVQMAFLTLGAVLFLSQQDPTAAAEPIRSRQTAAFFIGTALVLLLLVVRRFKSEPHWLLVPIVVTSLDFAIGHLPDIAAQLGVVRIPYDPAPPVPAIASLIVLAIYVAAYRQLTRSGMQVSAATH